jgi:hypothetical protein
MIVVERGLNILGAQIAGRPALVFLAFAGAIPADIPAWKVDFLMVSAGVSPMVSLRWEGAVADL